MTKRLIAFMVGILFPLIVMAEPPSTATYVGDYEKQCKKCHFSSKDPLTNNKIFNAFKDSKHGKATEAAVAKKIAPDFAKKYTLKTMQCEACHGPASAHVAKVEELKKVAGSLSNLTDAQKKEIKSMINGNPLPKDAPCLSCHKVHEATSTPDPKLADMNPKDEKNPAAKKKHDEARKNTICAHCHK